MLEDIFIVYENTRVFVIFVIKSYMRRSDSVITVSGIRCIIGFFQESSSFV